MSGERTSAVTPSAKAAARETVAAPEGAGGDQSAQYASIGKPTVARHIVDPLKTRELLSCRELLRLKFLEAKRGNAGLFRPVQYPIGSVHDDPKARERDWAAYGQELKDAEGKLANVYNGPIVTIESLVHFAIVLATFLPELRVVQQWQEFQEAAGAFANSLRYSTPAGNQLFTDFDPSPLLHSIERILDVLPGNGKPAIPYGKASVRDAVRVVEKVIAWCGAAEAEEPGGADEEAESVKESPSNRATARHGRPATKIEQALGLLVAHPDWSNKRIAIEVGCHPKHLSRSHRFKQAREALKSGKAAMPKGSKDAETGSVEAWRE